MNHDNRDIHDMFAELTRSHTHREPYTARRDGTTWTSGHVTDVPALIDQLLGATPAGSTEDSGSTTGKSKPAARIEAIDTLMLIDDEATRWLTRLGADDPNERLDPRTRLPIPNPRASTRTAVLAVLNRLHGLHPSATHQQQNAIERDVRRWWHQARIISGWDSAAWRPDNTCPVCEVRRSLRINLTTQTAVCVECREVWDNTTIGVLAEHVRNENADTSQAS